MAMLGIGEVARRTGLRPSAVRYYESVGLLTPPQRAGGRRRYESGAVDTLRVITMARSLGFSLEEIRTLLNAFEPDTPPTERWRMLARRKLPEIESRIRDALAVKRLLEVGLRCGCLRIEDCFLNDCAGTVRIRMPESHSPRGAG